VLQKDPINSWCFTPKSSRPLCFIVGSDWLLLFSGTIRLPLVFCGKIQSSNHMLQCSSEFLAGVEVVGEISFVVGFLWNFSLFIFGVAHFLIIFF
jgi:hypothetical protein